MLPLDPLSVLMVEDDADCAYILTRTISRHSTAVLIARTASEALAHLAKTSFDAILLDLNLPDSKGVKTIATIRKHTDCPIIVLTGEEDPHDTMATEAINAGAQDWLSKGTSSGLQIVRAIRLAIARVQISKARTIVGSGPWGLGNE